jgi:hypothetical protein
MNGHDQGESRSEYRSAEKVRRNPSRRAFLGQAGGIAATVAVGVMTGGAARAAANGREVSGADDGDHGRIRAMRSFTNRVGAAQAELGIRVPNESTNGDEQQFANHIGSFSKGLLHNGVGEVDNASYASLLRAVNSGDPRLFEQIQMGGNTRLVDPQAGLAFDLKGTDSHQLAIGTPPSVTSREIAAAAVENYWMALCRDVNFTQYGNEPLTEAAIAELNALPGFRGPKPVTPRNLFRGFTAGDLLGPYPSQFLLQPFSYGAVPVTQPLTTYTPGIDYVTDQASWLAVQNGQGPFPRNQKLMRTHSTCAMAAVSPRTYMSTCSLRRTSTRA